MALIRHLRQTPTGHLAGHLGFEPAAADVSTFIGPKGSQPLLPDWLMMGSWASRRWTFPSNGLFVMGLTAQSPPCCCWPLHVPLGPAYATVSNRMMADAIGIQHQGTDRLSHWFARHCRHRHGAAFTTIGSTGPTSGSLLHRRTLHGGDLQRGQPVWHRGLCLRHCANAVHCRVLHDRLERRCQPCRWWQTIGRPQGLFAAKVRH